MLLTLMLPHDAGDSLRSVLSTVKAAFAALVAGKGWQTDKARFGLAHYIRAHDCTHAAVGTSIFTSCFSGTVGSPTLN